MDYNKALEDRAENRVEVHNKIEKHYKEPLLKKEDDDIVDVSIIGDSL